MQSISIPARGGCPITQRSRRGLPVTVSAPTAGRCRRRPAEARGTTLATRSSIKKRDPPGRSGSPREVWPTRKGGGVVRTTTCCYHAPPLLAASESGTRGRPRGASCACGPLHTAHDVTLSHRLSTEEGPARGRPAPKGCAGGSGKETWPARETSRQTTRREPSPSRQPSPRRSQRRPPSSP